jgi:hypothetical protein
MFTDKMSWLTTCAVLLLVGWVSANPITDTDVNLHVTSDLFPDTLSIYTSEYDIVKIFVPINALNFDDEGDSDDDAMHIFFVEATKDENGNPKNVLSVLKNGEKSKILENGNDAAGSCDDSKLVFFGASDGIYVYNAEKNSADKYGSITENVVGIAKENGTDIIYILTKDHEVYKVSNEGTTKELLSKAKNARQIVLDMQNNLYYVDGENHVYVYSEENVKKISGLPANPSYIQLLTPPFIMEDSVPLVAGKKTFYAYANGTSEYAEIVLDVQPTAYSMEATLIQYYAYNKKIYEYNILALVMSSMIDDLKNFFDDKVEQIQSIATRSRKEFGA